MEQMSNYSWDIPNGESTIFIERYGEYVNDLLSRGEKPIPYKQWKIAYCNGMGDISTTISEKRKSKRKNRKSKNEIYETLGSFYFCHYKELLSKGIEKQYLGRFIYLCTFLDFDDNYIHYGKSDNGLATEKDLKEILNLKDTVFKETKKALIQYGLITINEDKTISINENYCKKGEIKSKRKLKESVRMIEESIKLLYEKAKPTEHIYLGLLVQLLPYVNYEYNILCENPKETEPTKVKPLTLKQLAINLGYKNSTDCKKDLLKLKLGGENVSLITETDTLKKGVVINPMLYYKGSDISKLKGIIALFQFK